MYKIAVMGDYDSIYGFAALGLDVFPVTEREEAGKLLHRLSEGDYGVIYITEGLAAAIASDIAKYADRIMPAIILIPGVFGNTGEGIRSVRKSVEQAVGSDILFGNE
ncbi:MAG: V-type ATP synthase subunit F [Lachnospiraceae bacterium]|nr:V-type ATP synthase subunit F [Lachnospiraceae bacterium]